MECNAKPSLQWEWENLISFGASSAETPRKIKPMEWELDGFDCTSLYSSNFAAVGYGGSSGSDIAHAFSKSSKSASISSSSAEVRTYNFTSEAGESLPGELGSSEEFAKGINTSPSLELSFGSGDPVLGLKLGKRTYFEDFWEVENGKGLGLPVSLASSSVSPVKKAKPISQRLQTPHCQVEGCNIDLSSAKDYHRKHRICENHSKFPKVVVSGVERRFCQQCSRFHCLSEFDEKKRSCRRRLSDHNARRRKPNPGRTYDGKPQVDFVWNRFALIHPRSEENFLWPSSKPVPSRGLMQQPTKTETSNKLFTEHCGFGLLDHETKTARAELFSKEKVTISSHMGASQDLDGALSLLSNSTTSWDQPRRFSLDHHHPTRNLQSVAHRSVTQLNSVSNYWQPDPPAVDGPTTQHRNGIGQFNENYFSLNQFYN
ncbi:PREDICTED: squamosa promoter-binding-like protein 2 [Camelina sativa]|uniref:Squamosa promoter-binding-like protein 2 n=1 Tax=Camelina sativa TaxID=90675 RepID=A0ABM0Y243_CAMSA|nr:PREDICTED: squamosa promoter-binding-like protein 2 [Camelina sativa]XP_010494303.1 PREDICTED: squamosa promoter-binding-like protein 2 [Camelina sativa]XP_010494304.1 PREDICTED: squamosa promoter-binding-like protein 2 [Camelina sativa]XP_010494305.1 PREDICTED: squamosa promoter-binding-like protein 2 [Camelina sativa]XP_010494306.1 PREDICTED: squamosa promoter-binding-like protein 2 [Camelina sativa]